MQMVVCLGDVSDVSCRGRHSGAIARFTSFSLEAKHSLKTQARLALVVTFSLFHAVYGRASAAVFSRRVFDISRFLVQLDWPDDVAVEPLRKRIAVHLPCSMANTLRDNSSTTELLRRIPGADIVELPDNRLCCGAAGSYMVEHPIMADALLGDKLDYLQQLKPDILTTANIGCALHFRHGLKQRGLATEVMHPVALLERQLCLPDS